jgi:hypothetical protein
LKKYIQDRIKESMRVDRYDLEFVMDIPDPL